MAKKALVVDNDFFFVEFLTELLEKRGFEVMRAYDGKEAISKLDEGAIDFLFLDIIMPKIDGKQVIQYTEVKFPNRNFRIIAMSGSLIEQLDNIKDLGADYYIAKGPMQKMKAQINNFLDQIENNPLKAIPDSNVLEPDGLYPREATEELIDLLNSKLAVIESAGVGIMVLDKDARILSANPMALYRIQNSLKELLNRPITDVFHADEKAKIVAALKKVIVQQKIRKSIVSVTTQAGEVEIYISVFRKDGEIAGWVLAIV